VTYVRFPGHKRSFFTPEHPELFLVEQKEQEVQRDRVKGGKKVKHE
jgi:hypothetical protein